MVLSPGAAGLALGASLRLATARPLVAAAAALLCCARFVPLRLHLRGPPARLVQLVLQLALFAGTVAYGWNLAKI